MSKSKNSETVRPGLHVYIGTTGTGKTHLAASHAIALAKAEKKPLVIVDSRGAENLAQIQPVVTVQELRSRLTHSQVSRFLPSGNHAEEEFQEVIELIDSCGNCIVLIDEVAQWGYNRSLISLCRVWRHKKVSLFMTTQKIGRDLEQGVLACDPVFYLFRITAPATMEWVEKHHRITPDKLKALQVGQHYVVTF